MELNREPGNKFIHVWSNYFQQGAKIIQWGKKQSFKQMFLGKLNTYMLKNEFGFLPNTIYRN